MIREKLIAFFRSEIDAEEQWGFPRLNRIPESYLQDRLNHYRQLSDNDQQRYKDCSATFLPLPVTPMCWMPLALTTLNIRIIPSGESLRRH
jgi:hypothetical protein